MDDATVALRIERRLKPKQKDNFGMFTSDSILAIYHQATNGIFAVLVGVVALSLLVGGIVIMNIMLMVVTERTFEIGLRKALGAKRRDIMLQVLAESVTLSVAGGIVGTSLGFLLACVISSAQPAARVRAAVVGRARHRHHGDRRRLVRRLPGHARRAARPDRSAEEGLAMAMRIALFTDIIGMAVDTLRANKLRAALTILGVVIGITAIVGHDVAHPGLRRVAARLDPRARARTRCSWRSSAASASRRARSSRTSSSGRS